MKVLQKHGRQFAFVVLGAIMFHTANAESTTYEWETESGLLFSSNQQAIDEITGQTSVPINTPVGARYFVQGTMNGTFTFDPGSVTSTEPRGRFLAYNGPVLDWQSQLVSAGSPVGTYRAQIGNVVVGEGDGAPGGLEDSVGFSVCNSPCGVGAVPFDIGAWQSTGGSVVFLGEGIQDGLNLPNAIPDPGATTVLGIFSFFNSQTGANVSILSREVRIREAAIPVAIDIKPGSEPNCFNINGHGVIPVAILGAADLDVANVDQESLSFGGLSVRVRGNKFPQCNVDYADGDEYLDLVCQFADDSSAWVEGGDTATLTGKLLDGSRIEGSDSICLRP